MPRSSRKRKIEEEGGNSNKKSLHIMVTRSVSKVTAVGTCNDELGRRHTNESEAGTTRTTCGEKSTILDGDPSSSFTHKTQVEYQEESEQSVAVTETMMHDGQSKETDRGVNLQSTNRSRQPEGCEKKRIEPDSLSASGGLQLTPKTSTSSGSSEIKFDETLLNEFKRDYRRCGKYDLDSQVVHLGRLADHYKKKYTVTGHWTDCLKAHSLYNSCYARKPKSVTWARKAFQMQQAYWNGCTSYTYEDQKVLTESLVSELEAIRTEEKDHLSGISDIVRSFDSEPDDDLRDKFSLLMRDISLGCSQNMRTFAGRIMRECVEILGQEPPCNFEAVAMGSLARGDATPYSDLEYLFLIDKKNHGSEAYFEKLAVTSYFLIGNLCETKLSYMAIEELAVWFSDCSKNGFKIDGLSQEAGNIPTGNGAADKRNFYIITPDELAERYGHVLDSPDSKQSRKGDLTAMLKFTRSLYSYGRTSNLLNTLRNKMAAMVPNESRKKANIDMIESDMAKFRFKPDVDFLIRGYAVDVKRHMYRFPSLLVLDLSIVFDVRGASCWDVVHLLDASVSLKGSVNFILACACYIRLAAYIFHDSHNDAMSVAGAAQLDQRSYMKSHPQQRWQAPQALFCAFCDKVNPLRLKLTSGNIALGTLLKEELLPSHWIHKFTTLHFIGNDNEALTLLMKEIGQPSLQGIDCLFKHNIPEVNTPYMMLLIADVMRRTGHIKTTLQICCRYQTEYPVKYASALISTGRIAEAEAILSVADLTPGVCHALCKLNVKKGRYDLAEENSMQALLMEGAMCSNEPTYNYFGELIEDKEYKKLNHDGREIVLPTDAEGIMKLITSGNSNVLILIQGLCDIFIQKEQYKLAESCVKKSLDLSFKLYGDENTRAAASLYIDLGRIHGHMGNNEKLDECFDRALSIQRRLSKVNNVCTATDSIDIAMTLNNMGVSYKAMKNYIKAEEFYTEALAMHRRLSPDTDNVDIAGTLSNMGASYNAMNKYIKAENFYTQALAMYRRLSPDTDSVDIAMTLNNMGVSYKAMKNYIKAEEFYTEALAMRRRLSPDTDNVDIAMTLCNMGVNYNTMNNYIKAEEFYTEALAMHRRLSPDTDNVDIAGTLSNMGVSYKAMKNYIKAEEFYTEALAMHRRLSPDTDNVDIAGTLSNMGVSYKAMKNYIKAEEFYTEALAMFRRLSPDTDSVDIAMTLCNMGVNYDAMRNFIKAEEFYTEALAMYRRLLPDTDSIDIAMTLNNMGVSYKAMKNYIKAEEFYTEALAMHRRLSPDTDNVDIAGTLSNMGASYNAMNKYIKAENFYTQALAMYRRLSPDTDSVDIAMTLNNMGVSYKAMKNYIKAEEFYTEALAMRRRLSPDTDNVDIAMTLCNMGVNYNAMKNFIKAEEFYTQALAMYRRLLPDTDSVDIALTMVNMGANCNAMKYFIKAEEFYTEALAMFRRLSPDTDSVDIAMTLCNMGVNYNTMNNYIKAEEFYTEALAMYRRLSPDTDSVGIAKTLLIMGVNYNAMKNYTKAEEFHTEALAMFRRLSPDTDSVDIARTLCNMGVNYKAMNNYIKAEEFDSDALAMRRRLSLRQ